MSTCAAFELLASPIQRVLWDLQWPSLRPIQEEAIRILASTDADLLISAQTAAGKTEAAFLPILSRMFESPADSVQALYVGPLKALINDQFRRLERLCERADIPVHRWHGDVDAGRTRSLLSKPSGVLLITPESLESLFINQSAKLGRLFSSLDFVVIDEIHAVVGSERGTHLRSLLHRLQARVDRPFRLVGLSATIGDAFPVYARWLRPDCEREVRLIQGPSGEKRLLFKIHAYSLTKLAQKPDGESIDGPPKAMTADLYEHFIGAKGLVFTNRKADIEHLADGLNAQCRAAGLVEEFLVHHGSLGKEIRAHTEAEMQSNRPRTTLCSSTLELGIDIGSVTAVGQVDPPWSVSSLVQRLGRSGRGEGEPQCLRMYVREDELSADSTLVDRLYPDLLRAVALTELMLQDPPWVEPPNLNSHDLSTLTHQLLSLLVETGGRPADELYEILCVHGAFRSIDKRLFIGVLRSLGDRALIQQMEGGDLILAPAGEEITGHYSFYSAFAVFDEYSVFYGPSLIGMLPATDLPRPRDCFLLAGRRWQVVAIEHERRSVVVRPATGKKLPMFTGGGGDIHPQVRTMMRDILFGQRPCQYLNATGARMLADARKTALEAGLQRRAIIALSPTSSLWFTWAGTKVQRTLMLVTEALGLSPADHQVAIQFAVPADTAIDRLKGEDGQLWDAVRLAEQLSAKQLRKFDQYLDDWLLTESLAADFIDVTGAQQLLTGRM